MPDYLTTEEAAELGYIDAVMTNGANMIHDLVEAMGRTHYQGRVNVDDEKAAIMVPALTSAAGLVAGALITRGGSNIPNLNDPARANALINLNGTDWSLALPMPLPTVLQRVTADGRTRAVIGMRVSLLEGKF